MSWCTILIVDKEKIGLFCSHYNDFKNIKIEYLEHPETYFSTRYENSDTGLCPAFIYDLRNKTIEETVYNGFISIEEVTPEAWLIKKSKNPSKENLSNIISPFSKRKVQYIRGEYKKRMNLIKDNKQTDLNYKFL